MRGCYGVDSLERVRPELRERVLCAAGASVDSYIEGRSRTVNLPEFPGLSLLGLNTLGNDIGKRWDEAENSYFQLTRVVKDAFIHDPHLGLKDLLTVLDRIPDPPLLRVCASYNGILSRDR